MAEGNFSKKFDHLSIAKVEDVDTFLVCECPNSQSPSYKKFIEYDKYLNDFCNEKFEIFQYSSDFSLKRGETVIVRYKGRWVRGIIEQRVEGNDSLIRSCLVYFCDFGMSHYAKDNEIFPVCSNLKTIPYLSKRIKLVNLSPISLSYSFEPELKIGLAKCMKWDSSAKIFVENLMKYISVAEFECVSESDDGSYCGNLYFEPHQSLCQFLKPRLRDSSVDMSQKMSLADILVGCEFAIHKEDYDELPKALVEDSKIPTDFCNNNMENLDNSIEIIERNFCSTPVKSSRIVEDSHVVPSPIGISYAGSLNEDSEDYCNSDKSETEGESDNSDSGTLGLPNESMRTLDTSIDDGTRHPSLCVSSVDTETKPKSISDSFKQRKLLITASLSKSGSDLISSNNIKLANKTPESLIKIEPYDVKQFRTDNDCSVSAVINRNRSQVGASLIDLSSRHASTASINLSAGKVDEEGIFSYDTCADDFSLLNNSTQKMETLPSYLINCEKENRTEKVDSSKDFNSSCGSLPSLKNEFETSYLVMGDAINPSKNELILDTNSKSLSQCGTLDTSVNDVKETMDDPKVTKRGLVKLSLSHDNCLADLNWNEKPLYQNNLESFVSENILKLNLCSGCQGKIQKCLTKKAVTSSINNCDAIEGNTILKEKESDDSKLAELISAGRVTSLRTCPVYYAGSDLLSTDELVFDERDMRMCLDDYICDQIKNNAFVTRLQSYFWPVVAKGRSCLAIGGKRCGKTIGYLLPVLSLLMNELFQESKQKTFNLEPSVIIICFGWKNVNTVVDLALHLIPSGSLKIIHTWGSNKDEEKATKILLLGGSDVLITTIPCLTRLLNSESEDSFEFVSLKKCSRLILDDLDQIYKTFPDDVEKIISDWNRTKEEKRQFIATSSSWFEDAYKICGLSKDIRPNLLISSYLETAVACQIETNVHHINPLQDTLGMAIDLVRKHSRKRIVIFTYKESQLVLLKRLLASISVYGEIITSNDLMWKINKKLSEWKEPTRVMLVCDNPINPLLHYDIRDAEVLIQVGVPPSKYQFGFRYSVMIDNFSMFRVGKEQCVCHLILNDEMIAENDYLHDELTRMGVVLDQQICALKQEAIKMKKMKIKCVPLCHYVKALGICCLPDCEWRHNLQEEDQPRSLPTKGEVDMDIVHVLDASHYFVRLTSYSESDEKVDLTKYYKFMFGVIQEYFGSSKNKILLKLPKEGYFCAVENSLFWARAKVIEVDYIKKKAEVSVFLIDEGKTIVKDLSAIYHLPRFLKVLPQLITEVYLCDIQPTDQDINWTLNATHYISNLLNANRRFCTYSGKIALTLNNTMWLSPVIGRKRIGKSVVNQRSLKNVLLALKFGVHNLEHMTSLKNMCNDANLSVEELVKGDTDWIKYYETGLDAVQKYGFVGPQIKEYVFNEEIELPYNERTSVIIGEIISPLHFYVMKKSQFHRLDDLSKEIETLMDSSLPLELNTDDYCVVASPEGSRFSRGKVTGRDDNGVQVFFFDYGKTELVSKDLVFSCPPSIKDKLPPQAHLCELNNISISAEFIHEATDTMKHIISSSDNWSIVVCDIKDTPNGILYFVDLCNATNKTSEPSLCHKLLSKGLVVVQLESESSEDSFILKENKLLVEDKIINFIERKNHQIEVESACGKETHSDENEIDNFATSQDFSELNSNCSEVGVQLNAENNKEHLTHIKTHLIKDKFIFSGKNEKSLFPKGFVCPSSRKSKMSEHIENDWASVHKMKQAVKKKEVIEKSSVEDVDVLPLTKKNISLICGHESVEENNLISEEKAKVNNPSPTVFPKFGTKYPSKECSPISSALDEMRKNANVLHPQTYWKQNESTIFIKFLIADVTTYDCKVQRTLLQFRTHVKDVLYIFDENLYGVVDPNVCSNVVGTSLSLTLKKVKQEMWPRLLWTEEKVPWLHSNLEDLTISEVSFDRTFDSFSFEGNIEKFLPTCGGRPGGLSDNYESSESSSFGSFCD